MIIDCHGHYTTAPSELQDYRDGQIAHFEDASAPPPNLKSISDDQIRESIESNQLKAMHARGADLTVFSPKASAMAHHIGDEAVSKVWTRINNDMIHRVTQLFPESFIGVCQLPQSIGVPIANSTDDQGRWTIAWESWPEGFPSAFELYFQYALEDAANVTGVALSNVLKATTP